MQMTERKHARILFKLQYTDTRLLGIAKKHWIGQNNPTFLMCLQTRAMMMKVSKGMEVKLAGDGPDYEVVKHFGHQ